MHGYFLLLLQKAKELGIHRTVHAGENGPAADVEEVCWVYGIRVIAYLVIGEIRGTILTATQKLCTKSH